MVRLTRRKALAAAVAVLALLALGIGGWLAWKYLHPTPQTYYDRIASKGGSFPNAFEDRIPALVSALGMEGAMDVISIAERNGKITEADCHPIIHLLGHEAYKRHLDHDPVLMKKYGTACQGALEHGIEAQIVFEEVDPVALVAKLHAQCAYFQSFFPAYPCYHGAGHAFFQMDSRVADTQKALARCDSIGPPQVVDDCYRGVFSEITDRVVGFDGETGLPIPGPHARLTPPDRPLAFCYGFGTQYEDACVTQLTPTTFGSSTYQGGGDFSGCLAPGYDALTRKECVHITANAMAFVTMTGTSTFRFPAPVLKLPPDLQEAAIDGIREMATAYESDGFTRNWEASCSIFPKAVAAYCVRTLKG